MFFFSQKTAYEMRISDWSSDVCSSDLQAAGVAFPFAAWSLEPVPPLAVPRSLSAAFWGGLWGVVYALLEPKLTARLGWLAGGLVFGALPVLVLWFVVLPLQGLPVGGGFTLDRKSTRLNSSH